MEIRRIEDGRGLEAALSVRRAVFVDEQGVPEDRELDGLDEDAIHFVACDGDEAIGVARLRAYDNGCATGKIERVAVLENRRGDGIGRELMAAAEETAAGVGYDELVLHAQAPVVAFYRRLGYRTEGEEFEDAGIPHRSMRKRI